MKYINRLADPCSPTSKKCCSFPSSNEFLKQFNVCNTVAVGTRENSASFTSVTKFLSVVKVFIKSLSLS